MLKPPIPPIALMRKKDATNAINEMRMNLSRNDLKSSILPTTALRIKYISTALKINSNGKIIIPPSLS